VAIARALVADPAILLADEPTGNLDPGTGAVVFEMMRSLAKKRGMATIVATHNENLARACDKIMQLCEGKLRDVSLNVDGSGIRVLPGSSEAG
jgi:lipoprotein-releasing system ATP-binding protein